METSLTLQSRIGDLLASEANSGRARWRRINDRLARYGVAVGGISVILAVVLIFFYLLYVVMPVFSSASVEALPARYTAPSSARAPLIAKLDEYGELGFRLDDSGRAVFFDILSGKTVLEHQLALPEGSHISSVAESEAMHGLFALGLSNGQALLAQYDYKLSYPDNVRKITPVMAFPYGEAPVEVDSEGRALSRLSVQGSDSGLSIAAVVSDGQARLVSYQMEENLMTETRALVQDSASLITLNGKADYLLLDQNRRHLYIGDKRGQLDFYTINDGEAKLMERLEIASPGAEITELRFLLGTTSLMVGDSLGEIAQWFPIRGEKGRMHLERIRDFQLGSSAITHIVPEARRKGFLAVNADGQLGIFHTTAEREVLTLDLEARELRALAIADRSQRMFLEQGDGTMRLWDISNKHPELSWSALWSKVWYEGYAKPDYVYQSSASNTDFEPKFSLAPLAFGTLKAMFYAMLFAIPLAIGAAMFTAFFMAPAMRTSVKPTIEIMGALPSVILGFLAGLWLAPFLEKNMPAMFLLVLLLPVALVGFGLLWQRLPAELRGRVNAGWQAAMVIPVIVLTGWLCLLIGQPVEELLFGGNMPAWLSNTAGINFEQRNSLVVGIAMGFAVIPSIYSIAEDALFSVPRSLVNGSLALGASPWQTMVRVILPTASPGIFSALMIGMGRAVGETMIVLMATGNTPIMEANIFEGLRTLSANIAVEMPESEVGSSHYRVLFLAALVLFLFTFTVNTLAELVRNRLRKKYGSL